jgi:murein L,D-transpeptidase YafK
MPRHRDWSALLLAILMIFGSGMVQGEEVRILVDTKAGSLAVLDGETVVHRFEDISIGRYGVTADKHRGDNRTPLGRFRVGWISSKTRYHRFLGLTFPDLESASRAFSNKLISKEEWLAIRYAHKHGEVPPQGTRMGGLIGIHGIGTGDAEMHRNYNWTNGCVALTNEEIDQLLEWVTVGTEVEIR